MSDHTNMRVSEGGYSSTGICLDCILAVARTLEEDHD